MSPLVSIIVPCYNSAATIDPALDSALAQAHPAIEVIVVVDQSRDRACGVVRARADERIRLVALARNDPRLLVGEDQDLWIRLALAGEVAWINETLVRVNNLAHGHMRTHAVREAERLLPMIERHVAAQRDRLGRSEARRILGRRCAQIGRNLHESGHVRTGARLVWRAVALGHQLLTHLAFPAHALPPGRWLKRRLRRQRGIAAAAPS